MILGIIFGALAVALGVWVDIQLITLWANAVPAGEWKGVITLIGAGVIFFFSIGIIALVTFAASALGLYISGRRNFVRVTRSTRTPK